MAIGPLALVQLRVVCKDTLPFADFARIGGTAQFLTDGLSTQNHKN